MQSLSGSTVKPLNGSPGWATAHVLKASQLETFYSCKDDLNNQHERIKSFGDLNEWVINNESASLPERIQMITLVARRPTEGSDGGRNAAHPRTHHPPGVTDVSDKGFFKSHRFRHLTYRPFESYISTAEAEEIFLSVALFLSYFNRLRKGRHKRKHS